MSTPGYVRPGAYSFFTQTAGSATLGAGTRIAAIIGTSYTTVLAQELVVRGASTPYRNTADTLDNTGVDTIISVGNNAYTSNYIQGVDFILTDDDEIDWSLGSGNQPTVGSKYFVQYTYTKPASAYLPQLLFSKNQAVQTYGLPYSDNPLGIAIDKYLANGPLPIIAVQTTDSSEGAFQTAIDALQYEVSGVDPTHIVILTTNSEVQAYLYNHCLTMSDPYHRKERRMLISTPVSTIDGTAISTATGYADKRVIYVPQWVNATLNNSDSTSGSFVLDGNYVACGVLGQLINADVEESITNKVVVGFDSLGINYLESEADLLAQNGCLILYMKGGLIKIRHDISTATDTPEDNQISILEISDYLIKNVRANLENQWLAKPIFGSQMLGNLERTTAAVLNKMIGAKIITNYSGISAIQDPTDQRRVNITFAFAPVYPLMWIYINFSYIQS